VATDPGSAWPSNDDTAAIDLHVRLSELRAERLLASTYGMTGNATYMLDLDAEIEEVTAAYTGAAVTEMATLRAELFGPQIG
jgi:hypothetical protein